MLYSFTFGHGSRFVCLFRSHGIRGRKLSFWFTVLHTRTLLYTETIISPSVAKNTRFGSLTTLNKLYTDRCTWSERWTTPAPVRWPPSPDKSQQQLRMSCCQQWRCTWICRVCLPSVDKTPSAWCRHSQSAECWRSLLTLPERRTWGCWERGTQWRQRGQTQTGSGSWQLESLCCSEVCLVTEKEREQMAWISSHLHLIIKPNTAQENGSTATHLSHGLV